MVRKVVTIDGPAGAGKSTVAKTLARRLGYSLLDTGAIYRAVALVAKQRGIPWGDATGLAEVARDLAIEFKFVGDTNSTFVAGDDVSTAIRTPEISQGASQVSAHGPVRTALLDLQRRLGAAGGVVVEGRDTGTVVFPHADAKFFLLATEDERARRRVEELRLAGKPVEFDVTLEEIRERDHRDSNRDVAPMKAAGDATVIDSSTMTIEEVVDLMMRTCRDRS
ncbi:MAG: (d)CMP kinase [Kofleriaceae bacterium]